MRRSGMVFLALAIVVGAGTSLQTALAKTGDKHSDPPLKLRVGDTAPDFELLAFDGKDLKKVALHDYRGKKKVALAFYVFAFTSG